MIKKPVMKINLPELVTLLKTIRTLNNQLLILSKLPLTQEQESFVIKSVMELSKTVNSFLASTKTK